VGEGSGALLEYLPAFAGNYDSAEQVVCVYTRRGPDGSTQLEPEMFADIGVVKVPHQRLFRRWFEARASEMA